MAKPQDAYDYMRPLFRRVDLQGGIDETETGAMNAGLSLIKRRRDGKVFVMKCIIARTRRHFNGKPSVEAEIDILEQLRNHPNITHMTDYVAESYNFRSAALIMEYCDLGSLEGVRRRSVYERGLRLPEGFIWHVFQSVANALAFLHYGINVYDAKSAPDGEWDFVMHGDLKPANIFLKTFETLKSPYPRVVLGDFGLAKTWTELRSQAPSKRDASGGTVAYSPPEFPCYERKSDVWALAAVVQDLLGVSRYDRARKRVLLEPDLSPVNCSPELLSCIYAARMPDPRDRIPSVNLVLELTNYRKLAISRGKLHEPFAPLEPWHFTDR